MELWIWCGTIVDVFRGEEGGLGVGFKIASIKMVVLTKLLFDVVVEVYIVFKVDVVVKVNVVTKVDVVG